MKNRTLEYTVALGAFITAVIFAFVSLYIAEDHEVAAGNCTIVAQFLLLTASIFGIDYKLNSYGHTSPNSRFHPLHDRMQDEGESHRNEG